MVIWAMTNFRKSSWFNVFTGVRVDPGALDWSVEIKVEGETCIMI